MDPKVEGRIHSSDSSGSYSFHTGQPSLRFLHYEDSPSTPLPVWKTQNLTHFSPWIAASRAPASAHPNSTHLKLWGPSFFLSLLWISHPGMDARK